MNSRKGLPYKYFASKYNCLLQKGDDPISELAALLSSRAKLIS